MQIIKTVLLMLICSFSATAQDEFTYIFAHGLGCDYTQADFYSQTKNNTVWIIQEPLISFNFPDADKKRGFVGSRTSLGQKNEILALANAHAQACVNGQKIIIMGMSRGASTIINFLALHQPTEVVAAVVESPFDSIPDIVRSRLAAQNVHWLNAISSVIPIIQSSPNVLFGKYDRNGIFPIQVIDKLKRDFPIFIIASLEDGLIPAIHTANIYFKLLERGHTHAYFLLLNKGTHANLLWQQDGDLYLNAVHAFYKEYDLPHHAAFATLGEAILAQCKPTKEMVEKAIANNSSYIVR